MTTKKNSSQKEIKPSRDPKSREKQLINLAVNLAEKQMRDGSASPSVITHFLKLGTERAKVEQKLIDAQATLAEAKATSLENSKNAEVATQQAIEAMKKYSGTDADNHE